MLSQISRQRDLVQSERGMPPLLQNFGGQGIELKYQDCRDKEWQQSEHVEVELLWNCSDFGIGMAFIPSIICNGHKCSEECHSHSPTAIDGVKHSNHDTHVRVTP
ncbi:hypothetical protein CEXT_119841 [Caerostris extrusa]|uniref:Uncharacterized protein n=1 Tax=Caerostris extrusa TaxID=172846 RepID=A0AAV4U545_CAEEX|nr:hypothetical protein CEXT_119841 [Caerostris extrusa]